MSTSNIHFKITTTQLQDLLVKIKDLVKIDSRLVIKINNENVLLFSFVGDSFKNIHAFKNYIFSTSDLMSIKEEILDSLILIVKDGKRFYKVMENFLDYNVDIKGKISYDEDNYVNVISFDNDKINTKIIGGDPITIGKEISIEDIDYLMNIENSLFAFTIDNMDFDKIKKLSLTYKKLKDVIYVHIKDREVLIGESLWSVKLCDMNLENSTISFPKDYFISMNPKNSILCYVFETFILFKYDDYNLMVVLETGS